MLTTQKTQIEKDIAAKDESVRTTGRAIHHLAATLKEENRKFWLLPDDRLLAVLNADVPQTLATFAANTALGSMVNSQLDALSEDPELAEKFPSRAPVEMGRTDVAFDQQAMQFVIIPPEG